MTRTKYGIAVVLQSFGFYRKMKRMTDAAAELHLMQEGEEILGNFCWKNIEGIEEISMEYWNIRKIDAEMRELRKKMEEAEITLNNAQQERAALVAQTKDDGQGLYLDREDLFARMEELNAQRVEVMDKAMSVKRRFEALKTKVFVLKEEGKIDEPSYASSVKEIATLKEHFQSLKDQLTKIDSDIEDKQSELQELQSKIDDKNKDHKVDTSEIYALISRANRDISTHRAKLGLLREQHGTLCRQIGRHINIHHKHRPCRDAAKGSRSILEQVKLLRQSIHWNKKLIARAGG